MFAVGSASGIAQPHYLVFVELKGVRNLSEEQRYKVCNVHLRTLKRPFSLTAHYIPDCFLNPTVRSLPTGGLWYLPILQDKGQHRTNESSARSWRNFPRTERSLDGLLQYFVQHLQNATCDTQERVCRLSTAEGFFMSISNRDEWSIIFVNSKIFSAILVLCAEMVAGSFEKCYNVALSHIQSIFPFDQPNTGTLSQPMPWV